MKQFKITRGNKDYIIKASNNVEAVKKLRDAKLKDDRIKVGCVEIQVNNKRKAYSVGTVTYINGGRDEKSLREYAKQCIDAADKLRELKSKGYKEDSEEAYMKDSAVKDRIYVKPTGGWFYGIYGMEFISNGNYSDPYIRYKGRTVNYYDVEDALWEDYEEECKEQNKTPKESEFENSWVKKNANMAKYYAENAPQVRVKDSKDEEVSVEEQTEEIQDAAGNFSKLKGGSRNCKLFASTVESLSHSQGFYGRLIRDIEEMSEDEFAQLTNDINKQNFKEPLDVVMWLEG